MKYKGYTITKISKKQRMYEKGYRYRATGFKSKMYGKTLREIKELINKSIK